MRSKEDRFYPLSMQLMCMIPVITTYVSTVAAYMDNKEIK